MTDAERQTEAIRFCVYGHAHDDERDAMACDEAWDQSWRGSVCPLHDGGLRMPCACTPTPKDRGSKSHD